MSTNEEWDIASGVGITALMVASARALETKRADRLIDDPYAAMLVQAAGPAVPADFESSWQDAIDYIGLRSRFFDEWFEESCAAGVRQGIILAAGLDTRAFRLPWPPGFRLFEIDQPKVLAYKDEVLAAHDARPGCDRHAVAVDLREDWPAALRDAGFDPTRPTAWLAEGLLPYLPAAAEARLLEVVHELSAPGSRVAIENLTTKRTVPQDDDFTRPSAKWGVDLNVLLSPEDRPDPEDRLAGFGWRVRRETIDEAAARLGRELTETGRSFTDPLYSLTAELPS
ncbi:SAM-dependent methyltransferase [Saccharopolyspora sp. ASAGF58]|uniref:SAM-dependent methyltransferase n=1 Tax=Saccharopolyspora sp. ASAGF58 TaxID=2719023 RepID=UPI0014401D7B|nr:SAM-dependent methyltransferase [Saccharopolyspora sp. ASAGF58]QIZ33973.1 SAM-dependent methyltransferase [Saccharopolyspora sp. ASAGF58]